MQYNDKALQLLETSKEAYLLCYVSDDSYESALSEARIAFIHSYDVDDDVFQDTYDYEWKYVVPLSITSIKLPLKEKSMSINLDTKSDGTKQSTIVQFFACDHLPDHLKEVSEEFLFLAEYLDRVLPTSAEKSVTLRKLLESKDSAVRAALGGVNNG